GFILMMTLLYLFVITALVSSVFANSLLQTKIGMNTYDASMAFQNAEIALSIGELSIKSTDLQGQGTVANGGSYSFVRTSQQECGLAFYQVHAIGVHAKATVNLQSLWAEPTGDQTGCEDDVLTAHRVYWEMMAD